MGKAGTAGKQKGRKEKKHELNKCCVASKDNFGKDIEQEQDSLHCFSPGETVVVR